ncbi:MAG TPA: GTP cyclohydrolase I FolE [Anaerolineales bacterium]|nr:GTP cyclohydrolase I FolE [Anaerolineales bacterium]
MTPTQPTPSVYNLKADLLTSEYDHQRVENATRELLIGIGEDPNRQGLLGTPDRVARAFAQLLDGYRTDPHKLVNDALFDVDYDELVLVRDIEFNSLCEHHLLPFVGHAHVAYIPNGKVIGLSKIPRIVDMFAHRLQLQERMTRQIAEFVQEVIQPQGVAVILEGVHMCSSLRGVKKHDAQMVTSAMLGRFLKDPRSRNEVMSHIERHTRNSRI